MTLSDSFALSLTFIAPSGGTSLTFQLTITDNEGLQSTDICIVNISSNEPPVANAGSDQTVEEGDTATLDGSSSSDTDDGIASYVWEQTEGLTVTLSNTSDVKPTFTAPDVSEDGATLTFKLTVTDNGGLQSTDEVLIMVDNKSTGDSGGGGGCFTNTLMR